MNLKHDTLYTTIGGDVVHVANLLGHLVGMGKNPEFFTLLRYDKEGVCICCDSLDPTRKLDSFNIKAEFEGWESTDFDWPEWARFVTCDGYGSVEFWKERPYVDFSYWEVADEMVCKSNSEWQEGEDQPKYHGDWRNSLLECEV